MEITPDGSAPAGHARPSPAIERSTIGWLAASVASWVWQPLSAVGELGAVSCQRAADALPAGPRADDEAGEFGLVAVGDRAGGLAGGEQGGDADDVAVDLGDDEMRRGRRGLIEVGA